MTVRQSPVATTSDGRIAFMLGLARALHHSGHATHRLETALEAVSQRLGLTAQYFATPTSIFASFGTEEAQRTYMLRTAPSTPDLGRLVRTNEIAQAVLDGTLEPAEGTTRLAQLEFRPPTHAALVMVGFALASAAAARFLGGGAAEAAVAAGGGLLSGLVAALTLSRAHLSRIFEPTAALVCSFAIAAMGALRGGVSVPIATLAGLIVLVPGLALTTAIAELANDHLQAGTSRMAGAFMTFIGIGFGVALGNRLAAVTFGPPLAAAVQAVPAWTNWLALLGSAAAFAILLRADRRDWGWIAVAGALAFAATRAGSQALGAELGVFAGSLVVGLAANFFSRRTGRPSAVMLVPGLLTLVPGSIGFRSITALLENQVVAGIDSAFTMVLTAVSLVAGLLASAAVYPERPLA